MGHTLARMNGLMVMRANTPAPIFSALPAAMAEQIRVIPGARVVAPEVWRICPPLDGRNQLATAATKVLTEKGATRYSSFAETVRVEGQELPWHLHLKSGVYEQALLPADKGGGRFLQLSDVGEPKLVISTKIAGDFPNRDGTPNPARRFCGPARQGG
jgi:putative ABC transport system permease protein